MQNLETRMNKGRDGWQAKTEIPLDGITITDGDKVKAGILTISTRKHSLGGLSTGCSVAFRDGNFMTHRVYTDFNANYTRDPNARCTEKAIERMHGEALADIATIESAVRDHYAALESEAA
jgi:hypothetical protein